MMEEGNTANGKTLTTINDIPLGPVLPPFSPPSLSSSYPSTVSIRTHARTPTQPPSPLHSQKRTLSCTRGKDRESRLQVRGRSVDGRLPELSARLSASAFSFSLLPTTLTSIYLVPASTTSRARTRLCPTSPNDSPPASGSPAFGACTGGATGGTLKMRSMLPCRDARTPLSVFASSPNMPAVHRPVVTSGASAECELVPL